MKNENTTGIQQSGGKLGWGTRVAYGCGDTACNVVFGMCIHVRIPGKNGPSGA